MKKHSLILILLMQCLSATAQDLHFTQFQLAPWYINPASNGLFEGDYRIAAHYRRQYASIPAPFSTAAVHAEKRWTRKAPITLAADINSDRAGDNRYSASVIRISAAWLKTFDSDTTLSISIGLGSSLNMIRVNTNSMTFSRQFNGDGFDPGLSSGENFSRDGFLMPNMDCGFILRKQVSARRFYSIGTALFNGLPLQKTFLVQSTPWISLRSSSFTMLCFPVASRLDLMPSVLMQVQNKSRDLVLSGRARMWLLTSEGDFLRLAGGISWRYNDAVAVVMDAEYKNYVAGISYDITSSSLRNATAYRGGMELHLHYILRSTPILKYRKKDCPVFF